MLASRIMVKTKRLNWFARTASGLSRSGNGFNALHTRASTISRNDHIPYKYIRKERQLNPLVISKWRKGFGDVDDALSLFDNMIDLDPYPQTFIFNLVLSGVAGLKHYSTVTSLFKKMSELGIATNKYTLNILLASFCRLGRPDCGYSVLGSFFKLGHKPEITAYAVLMCTLVQKAMYDEVVEMFHTAAGTRSIGPKLPFWCVEPDSSMIASVLYALFETGKASEALGIFYGMERPSVGVYNTVIRGLCKIGRQDEAMCLYLEMHKPNPPLGTVAAAYYDDGDDDDGDAGDVVLYKPTLFRPKQDRRLGPNMVTFNLLIKEFSYLGRWKDVTRMLKEPIEPDYEKPWPLLRNPKARAEIERMIDETPEIYRWIVREEFAEPKPLDVSTFNVLLVAYQKAGGAGIHWKDLRRMLSKVQERKFSARMFYIYLGLDGFFKGEKEAEAELVADMRNILEVEYGKDIKADSLADVMKIMGLKDDTKMLKAALILGLMGTTHLKPNVVTCNVLMRDYCVQGQVDGALELLKTMKDSGLEPDMTSYNILINGLCKRMRTEEALELFQEMNHHHHHHDADMLWSKYSMILNNAENKEGTDEDTPESSKLPPIKHMVLDHFVEYMFDEAEDQILSMEYCDWVSGCFLLY